MRAFWALVFNSATCRNGTVTANTKNAAFDRKAVSCELHLGAIGFVTIGRPNLAITIGAIALRSHVPDDFLTKILGLHTSTAGIKWPDQSATNIGAARRNVYMPEVSIVIFGGFPDSIDRIGKCSPGYP